MSEPERVRDHLFERVKDHKALRRLEPGTTFVGVNHHEVGLVTRNPYFIVGCSINADLPYEFAILKRDKSVHYHDPLESQIAIKRGILYFSTRNHGVGEFVRTEGPSYDFDRTMLKSVRCTRRPKR